MIPFETLKSIILKLIDYCQKEHWEGYDPYDALNSPIFIYLPFLNFRWSRIAFTQFLKRSPINFRPLLGIPKTENPKAIALFLMSFIKLRKLGILEDDTLINLMANKLINLRSYPFCNLQHLHCNSINSTNSINSYWCWGYSFPWQTRTVLVPKGAPNIVCTTFVGNALLDMFEFTSDPRYLNIAKSAGEYIINELYWEDSNSISSFSYPLPGLKTIVHNANFLGSALLCRIFNLTKEEDFLDVALRVTRYSVSKQNTDGSWYYGEHPSQHWIDNFHTGYNLCALEQISEYIPSDEFEINISRGFEFYRKNFFIKDKIPKYYHNKTYPIDIHSIAQSIITLLTIKDFKKNYENIGNSILEWTIRNMWDKEGYFYFQIGNFLKKKIPYLRWSQAWMLFAGTLFLTHLSSNQKD